VYVPAGKFNPVVLILKLRLSTRVPVLLLPRILSVKICKELPAAKGLMPVKGPNAPPLGLPETLEDGMLSPAPSERAEGGLEKYAQTVTAPTLGCKVQAVVMATVALPFATPLGKSAKLTKPGDAERLKEVVNTAFKLMPAMFELSWACATEGTITMASTKISSPFAGAEFLRRGRSMSSCWDCLVKASSVMRIRPSRKRLVYRDHRKPVHASGVAGTPRLPASG